MIEATVFIGAVIVGITQLAKTLLPIHGAITILVALVVSILVALLDTQIGVSDITVAEGVMIGFGSVGAVTALGNVGNKPTNETEL